MRDHFISTNVSSAFSLKSFGLVVFIGVGICGVASFANAAQNKPVEPAAFPIEPKASKEIEEVTPCDVQEGNEVTPTTPYVESTNGDVTVVVQNLALCQKNEKILASDIRMVLDGVVLPKLSPTPGPLRQNY